MLDKLWYEAIESVDPKAIYGKYVQPELSIFHYPHHYCKLLTEYFWILESNSNKYWREIDKSDYDRLDAIVAELRSMTKPGFGSGVRFSALDLDVILEWRPNVPTTFQEQFEQTRMELLD